jgi:SAM-dependent MidA family methyltransferase
LVALGLADMLPPAGQDPIQAELDLSRQVQWLVSPAEMGELFKVLALTKKMELSLRGFTLHDRRASL